MAFGIGLIGCGFIGRFHARNIRDIARSGTNLGPHDVDYHAVCDREADRAAGIRRSWPAARSPPPMPLEVIHSPKVDAVYICTETVEHVDLVIAAAQAGKHVFCEKPLATNLADARRMHAAVSAAGVTHQVGLVLRFSPVFRVDRRPDAAGQPRRPARDSVARRSVLSGARPLRIRAGAATSRRAGGGTLIEHSIHDVDLIARLAGDIDTRALPHALHQRPCRRRRHRDHHVRTRRRAQHATEFDLARDGRSAVDATHRDFLRRRLHRDRTRLLRLSRLSGPQRRCR